ncbi:hypothetical protein [Methanobrevibacter sp.]
MLQLFEGCKSLNGNFKSVMNGIVKDAKKSYNTVDKTNSTKKIFSN